MNNKQLEELENKIVGIIDKNDPRPDICVCGNDMLVNSTKNTMIIYDDALMEDSA